MDPLEQARSNLRAERERQRDEIAKAIRAKKDTKERGEKIRLGKSEEGYRNLIELIDYVLNILENPGEE